MEKVAWKIESEYPSYDSAWAMADAITHVVTNRIPLFIIALIPPVFDML